MDEDDISVEYVTELSDDDDDITFPLPPHTDASLCRDEFLKTILKPNEQVEEVQSESIKIKSMGRMETVTAEGLAIIRMLQETRPPVAIEDLTQFRPSLTEVEKQVLYKICLYQFQKAAVEFLSVRMRKQIDTFLHIWPGEIKEIPHKLFSWSLEHFLRRHKVNQLYLDVLPMERSQHDLDCAKFCTDLKEIIRLLEVIKLDFHHDRDLCKSALVVMDDSNYEINSTWEAELEKLRNARKKLALHAYEDSFRTDSACGPKLIAENDKTEAAMHIELRYRINWMRSTGDQNLMLLQSKENVYQDEIDELQLKMQQDSATFGFVDFVYQYQIDNYRASITLWQEQLDADLEKAELECNITRNHWLKAKDELRFYKEQVEIYRRRVEEVNALIADEERQTKKSTKLSLGLRKSKAPKKGKEGKKKK